ncbi:hypothetical protein CHS0354_032723 [Potamilus streckersoni]|uniref:Uncharacterized protein n=1 Tax=Potamilus streckersoni TaxID=2493646 RepID=A0AAE0VIG1_9BIVA|nr:hypothetical protein CHS0354_032723 [Potamilus streckersoni]
METVWLKDVTTGFLTDKQTRCDPELPKELTFHLQRGSDILLLSLKRNRPINPDVYYVRRLKNGRSALLKRRNLGKELCLHQF